MKNDPRRQRTGDQRGGDGAVVLVEPGMPLDAALRTFKRRVERAGILREMKRREHFVSRSQARRAKSLRARKRDAKAAARRTRPKPDDA